MDGWEQLAALRAVYDGYLEEYRQRLIDNGPFHGLHKFLLGNAPASDRKADNAFFKAVQQAVGELEQALSGDPGPAAPAVRFMILEAEGPDAGRPGGGCFAPIHCIESRKTIQHFLQCYLFCCGHLAVHRHARIHFKHGLVQIDQAWIGVRIHLHCKEIVFPLSHRWRPL